ncbi:MAG: methyltransferase domain-containing protein [Bacteroidota bacterium]
MSGNKKLNTENNLVSRNYWDNSYENYQFVLPPTNDKVRQWIEQYIPPGKDKSCFEIGCFPGRYLSVFGQLGYELNGIDITSRVENDLQDWLIKSNFKVGEIFKMNVFDYRSPKLFDIVCSFGFIEHFKNWEEVLIIHAQLVKQNGFLIIETPNFRGFIQHAIHYVLDHENLERHFLAAMNPYKWKRVLEQLGFEIIYCGYFSEFEYWLDKSPTGFWKKILCSGLSKAKSCMKLLPPNNSVYSPYCGLIAKKSGSLSYGI